MSAISVSSSTANKPLRPLHISVTTTAKNNGTYVSVKPTPSPGLASLLPLKMMHDDSASATTATRLNRKSVWLAPLEWNVREYDHTASTGVTISTPRKSEVAQMRSMYPSEPPYDRANHATPNNAPSSALTVPATSIACTK